ncbi:MAG: alkaline phosphatase family protein [Acidobacteriota bacterium]
MRRTLSLLLLLLASAASATAPPKLIVVVSIDQFPSYYLDRYANVLGDAGFKRLAREGTFFVNSAYPYATTFTGPGHASIGTGHTPTESGIIGNNWYDRFTFARSYCAQDDRAEPVPPIDDPKLRKDNSRSPLNLTAASLGDRLQEKDRASKVYSVSLKDRAAILMGGRKAWGAFWFDGKAKRFMTSTYYRNRLEPLIAKFNAGLPARVTKQMQWTLDDQTKPANVTDPEDLRTGVKSDRNGLGVKFPHPIRDVEALTYTPFGNDMVFDLARAIIRGEQLGADMHPDLLYVSLSSPDYLGHAFGPDSWEAADTMVRTDRQLAAFVAELRRQFGSAVTVAVTGDHGVQSIPAIAKYKNPGAKAGRINLEAPAAPARKAIEEDASRRLGASAALNMIRIFDEGSFYLDFAKLPPGVEAEQARRAYRDAAKAMDGVSEAFTSGQLMVPNASPSEVERAVRNSFRPDRSGDVLIELQPGYIWDYDGTGTTHGQPVPDDQRVPVIVWGAGIVHGDEACRTLPASPLDLARTLGKLLGVDAGGKLSNDLECARVHPSP